MGLEKNSGAIEAMQETKYHPAGKASNLAASKRSMNIHEELSKGTINAKADDYDKGPSTALRPAMRRRSNEVRRRDNDIDSIIKSVRILPGSFVLGFLKPNRYLVAALEGMSDLTTTEKTKEVIETMERILPFQKHLIDLVFDVEMWIPILGIRVRELRHIHGHEFTLPKGRRLHFMIQDELANVMQGSKAHLPS
ncbi:hypothetical protein K469DRAFT_749115 [Zopfia rhizophila CBS 207.26]|uniref:Uncharacterized protein n=1 Tax=Zopfia rhizophila CBS 207.26 TaxID=1314779 RepID=A0A6A6E8E0_9PEZI|nr:hypothetical protein K469DRAFT_749115 [Zopfia rhizophila CBS 207.26]